MHGFVNLNPVFYCIFGSFYETELGLIILLYLIFLAEFVELLNSDALLLDAFLPDSLFLLVRLLLSFSLPLFFLHPEDLHSSDLYFCVLRHGKWTCRFYA